MLQQTVTVQVPCDQINNAVTQFIQKANSFSSRITVLFGENSVSAKSLLGLLSMELRQGSRLTISAEGGDAAEALAALTGILEKNA